jgi:hypothetical protein
MLSSQPRILVLGARKGRFRADSPTQDELMLNAHESWAYAFACDYINILLATPADIAKYDIVIANSEYKNPKFLIQLQKLALSRSANVKWVTLIEGLAGDYLVPQYAIRELFDASDLIICINKYTQSFFSSFTKTRCEYIGVPYPVDVISKFKIPIDQREKKIFICPNLLSRQGDYIVAKEIGLPYYGWEKRVHRTLNQLVFNLRHYHSLDANWRINRAKAMFNDPKLEIRSDTSIFNFFKQNNNSYIWVNMDDRHTWGRYVLDAAALGIPVITTKSTGHGEDLFPDTTIENEFEIDKAIAIGKRLATDPDFYRHVAEYPIGKMEHLKHESMSKKLLSIL